MILPDFRIEHVLAGGPCERLCRARRHSDGRSVLVKTAPREAAAELARELEISRRLNGEALREGVVHAQEILTVNGSAALVLDDPGGEPLDRILSAGPGPLPLEAGLTLASELAATLDAFHHAGLIHRDIRPSNILIDLDRRRARIMGFGLTSEIPRERRAETGKLEGAPAYMSPEQTGRTNRLVDYRTDFYSLGVTLYEIFTGRLPFMATDALGWVHAHVAGPPPSFEELAAEVPRAVSEIVLKLLAKTADDRYQGGQGLREDLERCLRELRSHGTIRPFPLGEGDLPARFELPQQLYGREEEMKRLVASFEDARRVPAVFIVTGPSGMGKTALIDEMRHHVLHAGGLFVGGKYEELGRARPLSGILEALRELVRRFLGADRETVAALERNLSERLGANLGVVVKALPELAALVGEQRPTAAALGPAEERRRFHRSIAQFLRAFATEDHPLVIFLDDLQWIDRASLELLVSALDPDAGSLLVLGAYRDDAVGAGDPLQVALDEIRRKRVAVDTLRLGPLGREAVGRLVSGALRSAPERTASLADVVFRQSDGHPFFVRSFLASLHERGILSVARRGGKRAVWCWDLGRIAELKTARSVIRLTAQTISRLGDATRRLIALAAALGGRFDPDELAVVGELSAAAAHDHLLEVCRAGLLVKCEGGYQFAHDRMREGAYALIPQEARAAAHLRIGRLLAGRHSPDESHGVAVFEIVDHFNRALDLLEDPAERAYIARLNLVAGRRARAGAAFSAAHDYFSAGLALLDALTWRQHYDLALALHNEAAQAAFLVGNFAAAKRRVGLVHRHTKTLLDEIPAYEVRISIAMAELRQQEALTTLLGVLRRLGVELSIEPPVEEAEASVLAADRALAPLLTQDPREAELMTDPATLAATRLLNQVVIIAGWSNQLLVWMAVCKALKLVVEHGQGAESALTYLFLGHMRCQLLDDVEGGEKAATFGLALLEHSDAQHWRSQAQNSFYLGVESFRSHLGTLIAPFAEVYRISLESGDLLSAMVGALDHCLAAFHSGMELAQLEGLIRHYHDELVKAGADRASVPLGRLRGIVLTLLGRTSEAGAAPILVRDRDPGSVERLHFRGGHAGHHFGITYCHDILLHHLFRHSRYAFEVAARAVELPEAAAVGLITSDFYLCLALLDGLSDLGRTERRPYLATVESRLRRMRRRCRNAPMNYRHKVDLVEAERRRVLGRPQEALELYNAAAQGARQNRYVQDEALALELAGELHLELGQPAVAAMYLRTAAAAYSRWGARGKLDQLAAHYPDLLPRGGAPPRPGEVASRADMLDKTSLLRAAQALSHTLELDQLLRELVSILLENAAAQRGFLLRDDGEAIVIEASGSIDHEEIRVVRPESLAARSDVAHSIVRYVSRTRETVVLGEAGRDDRFATDPYIARTRPKSILCLPILHQDRVVALVYLENNRIPDAFVADRLAAVQLIASQAAVALENARLHADLRQVLQTLEGRNADLESKNAELERFTYTVSHDLKSPLVTIRGFLGLLAKDMAAEDAARIEWDVEQIRGAAGHMAQLLDELLELSRIGRVVGPPEELVLGELAQEAVDLCAAAIAERGVEVLIANHLPAVLGDRRRLLEVFQNLVENAVKFMGDTERPRIEIGVRKGGDEAGPVCYVRDNGMGVAARYLEKVFGLFERLDAESPGTGVGLTLVKRIVEFHGGRIWAESEGLGRGTSFYFTLPPSGRP